MAVAFQCQNCGSTLSTERMPDGPIPCPQCQAVVDPAANADTSRLGAHDVPTIGALAALLPWAISFIFHVAVGLAGLFIVLTIKESADLERIIIPDARLTRQPGGNIKPAPQKAAIQANRTLRQMRTPVYEKHTQTLLAEQTTRQKSDLRIVGIGARRATAELGLRGFGGGGPKASFLGSGGNAYKIVYVIDRSGSMIDSFDIVKYELRKSINALQPIQSFHLIFFSDGDKKELEQMKPQRLGRALAKRKKDAFVFLETIVPEGRTNPYWALEAAFRVRGGPPDLIYFMTDGEFDRKVVADIREWNKAQRVKINTIAFLYPGGEPLLKQIARENNGTYKFVSTDELEG